MGPNRFQWTNSGLSWSDDDIGRGPSWSRLSTPGQPQIVFAANPGASGRPPTATSTVLLELEGPGIEILRSPGFELYECRAPERHQIILAGSVRPGPLMQFHVPDRNQLHLLRIPTIAITRSDEPITDSGGFRSPLEESGGP